MTRGKKVITNVITLLIQQTISIICGFIIPRMIITNYGSNVNGLTTSITQFLAYITLLESGFGPVVKSILYKPLAEKNKEKIEQVLITAQRFFRNISKIFLCYIVILCFVYPLLINSEFDFIYSASLVGILSINIFSEYFFGITYSLYLQADEKNYILSGINSAITILNTVVVIILIKLNLSIHIVKLISIVTLSLKPILISLYVKKKCGINIKRKNKNTGLKIEQRWDGLSQHIAYTIHNNTDIILLTIFVNTLEVSVYSVYAMILNALKNFTFSIKNGVESAFGDMIARNENENMQSKFKVFEFAYITIISIIYFCTLLLIVPFISVYTLNISDVNYIRPVFAYIITSAELMWAFRLPYASLTQVAGHFKQTKVGAWIEAIINITLSIVLVFNFGIIGVAIGTFVSILYRTIDYICYASKNILKRKSIIAFKNAIIMIIELLIICFIVPKYEVNSYFEWIKLAIIVAIIVAVVVISINCLCYLNEAKYVFKKIKNKVKGEKK